MTSSLRRTYGWIPDLPDQRDHLWALPHRMATLPDKVDMRPACQPVYDQGELGSCTANAVAAALDFERNRQKLSLLNPSRLFIYYNERVIEGNASSDSGAMLRDGMKTLAKDGACAESLWPYMINKFMIRPPKSCYAAAIQHKALKYSRVPQELNQMKGCLALGFPFVFGFTVYPSFETDIVAETGLVPMPGPREQVLGGHAVMAVGYDDATKRFLVRNSWGAGWGMAGYFTIPYAYLLSPDLADDFWTIRVVE